MQSVGPAASLAADADTAPLVHLHEQLPAGNQRLRRAAAPTAAGAFAGRDEPDSFGSDRGVETPAENLYGNDIESEGAAQDSRTLLPSPQKWRQHWIVTAFFAVAPYVVCFLITVSTILGTGILSLPVKVSNSGFAPFFVMFSLSLVMQGFIVIYMVELLQRANLAFRAQLVREQQQQQWTASAVSSSSSLPIKMKPMVMTRGVDGIGTRNSRAAFDGDGGGGGGGGGLARQRNPKQTARTVSKSDWSESTAEMAVLPLTDDDRPFADNAAEDRHDYESAGLAAGPLEDESLYPETDATTTTTTTTTTAAAAAAAAAAATATITTTTAASSSRPVPTAAASSSGPQVADLHFLGKLYLNRLGQALFDLCVVLHFVSILISYTLAGSKSYAFLFGMGPSFQSLILPFVLVYSLVVIILDHRIDKVLAVSTLAKGGLIVFLVAIVGAVASHADQTPDSDWAYMIEPFLISNLALGGVMNTMSLMIRRVPFTRHGMKWYRISILAGLVVCFILNVAWTYFILQIVPQRDGDISLKQARTRGEMATVPLVEVIKRDYPSYAWVATTVQVFILVSVSISYMTMSTGLKHMLDGYVRILTENLQVAAGTSSNAGSAAVWRRLLLQSRASSSSSSSLSVLSSPFARYPSVSIKAVLYFLNFGMVFLVAVLNPKAFLIILEYFTTLALNLESGVFVAYMLWKCRRQPVLSAHGPVEDIPLPLSSAMVRLSGAVILYFAFAVFYDIVAGSLTLSGKISE